MDKQTILLKASVLATTAIISLAATYVALAGSLYDAPPSATSAFVRFIKADNASADSGREWRDQQVSFADFEEGQYIAVESDLINTEPGNFITVAFQSGGETLEFNEIDRKKGKVALQMLNLSASPVSLKTADGKITILDQVNTGALEARQINPLAFSVRVDGESASLATLELALKRSDNPMIVVRPDGSVEIIKSALKGANNQ